MKTLTEQVVQYTREMEQQSQFLDGLKTSTQTDRGGWIMALDETSF